MSMISLGSHLGRVQKVSLRMWAQAGPLSPACRWRLLCGGSGTPSTSQSNERRSCATWMNMRLLSFVTLPATTEQSRRKSEGGKIRRMLGAGTISFSRSSQPSVRRPFCARNSSKPPPDRNSDSNKGNRPPTDWDKAWSKFRKQGKKSLFSQFKPDKYVSWNPRRSEYPLSEEVDPIKRTERSNLMLWTSPRFTLAGAIVIVLMLLIYTLVVPPK